MSEINTQAMDALRSSREEVRRFLLPNNREKWGVYDSSLRMYHATFRHLLKDVSILDLATGVKDPIVIDLMSSTAALADMFQQFRPDIRGRGLAVSLGDNRDNQQRAIDDALNIELIIADLTRPSAWQKIDEYLMGQKATLIIERGIGGADYYPASQMYYEFFVSQVWDRLSSEGGMALLQLPIHFVDSVNKEILIHWVIEAKSQGIIVEYDAENFTLLLARNHDSPVILPHLSGKLQLYSLFFDFSLNEDPDYTD